MMEDYKPGAENAKRLAILPTSMALNYPPGYWDDMARGAEALGYVLAMPDGQPPLPRLAGLSPLSLEQRLAAVADLDAKYNEARKAENGGGESAEAKALEEQIMSLTSYRKAGVFSHTVEARAQMLYETITARDEKDPGKYKYQAAYLSGGSNADDVIIALEKLMRDDPQKYPPLPDRARGDDRLHMAGFSDASQIVRYLGQKGVAQTYIWANNGGPIGLLDHLEAMADENHKESIVVKELIAPDRDITDGINMPPEFRSNLYSRTHQPQLSGKMENIMLAELTRPASGADMIEALQHPALKGKPITLMLSEKSSPDKEIAKLVAKIKVLNAKLATEGLPNIAVFQGAPFGHLMAPHNTKADWDGLRPIPQYTAAGISKTEDGQWVWAYGSQPVDKKEWERPYVGIPERTPPPTALATNVIAPRETGTGLNEIRNIKQVALKDGELVLDASRVDNEFGPGQMVQASIARLITEGYVKADEIKLISVINHGVDLNNPKECERFDFFAGSLKKSFLPENSKAAITLAAPEKQPIKDWILAAGRTP
ncbi:hypothetical protein FACS1894186_1810 [Alphaproteobacteria bacterium]|nr:hypothetical protein FACS1894186_1810 [Alphaproteobacteria bacterium]